MKKPRVRVSDHAVLRYLERVHGIDIEVLRREIGAQVDRARDAVPLVGMNGAVIDGMVYRLVDDTVVTVMHHSRPERGQDGEQSIEGRRKGHV